MRTAYTAFAKSLPAGEETEKKIAEAMQKIGYTCVKLDARSSYDFIAHRPGDIELVEVKDETRNAGMGNVCIELAQSIPQQYSGICTSESTIWIDYMSDDEVYVFRTCPLRIWVWERLRLQTSGFFLKETGDNHNICVMVSKARLKEQNFTFLGTISDIQFPKHTGKLLLCQ
jgi:hypothetical protein